VRAVGWGMPARPRSLRRRALGTCERALLEPLAGLAMLVLDRRVARAIARREARASEEGAAGEGAGGEAKAPP